MSKFSIKMISQKESDVLVCCLLPARITKVRKAMIRIESMDLRLMTITYIHSVVAKMDIQKMIGVYL